MKRTKFLLLTALCTLALCVFAFVRKEEPVPMPGNYEEVAVTASDVIKAAEFAVSAQSEMSQRRGDQKPSKLQLLKILGAEHQVVAGSNYRLTLSVSEIGKPQRTAVALVWLQSWRQNPYELTSWTWE